MLKIMLETIVGTFQKFSLTLNYSTAFWQTLAADEIGKSDIVIGQSNQTSDCRIKFADSFFI
jgi:hypothetical protein